jgi:hypothetical protein
VAATARVVVLMSPEEKAALDRKAAQAGRISAGELVRRAVEAYDEETIREAEELKALLRVLADTHAATLNALDRTDRKFDALFADPLFADPLFADPLFADPLFADSGRGKPAE